LAQQLHLRIAAISVRRLEHILVLFPVEGIFMAGIYE
jgi:hypothetical protein